jgi:hypothetical protein
MQFTRAMSVFTEACKCHVFAAHNTEQNCEEGLEVRDPTFRTLSNQVGNMAAIGVFQNFTFYTIF